VTLRIPPPVLFVLAGALMGALHHWLPLAHWIPSPWNRFGILLAAFAIIISATAVTQFRRIGTTVNPLDPSKATRLVTGGIFRISRNPMYLGLLLLLIGWAGWLGSASPWLVPPLFWATITFGQIMPEERALRQLFGAPYLAYQQAVGRWIGRSARR